MAIATAYFSDQDMACPEPYYGGFKEARVTRLGAGERSLSHIRTGDVTSATFDMTLSDRDGLISGWLASAENRYWTEALTVRMVSRAARKDLAPPHTVFSGPIVGAKPRSRPRQWDITLGDRVSQALLPDQAQAPWRRIGDGFLSQLDEVVAGLDPDTPEPIIYGIHKRLPEDAPVGEGLVYAPTYLGKMTVGGTQYHVWLGAGHACADVPDIFVDYVSKIADEGTHWLVPHSSGWASEFTTPYVDLLSDTFGDVRRYSLVLGKVGSPDPDACAAGEKSLTLWVEGVEPVGDGSGTVITKRFLQYKHFCINFVAHQGRDSYKAGPWLTNPEWTVSDGNVPIIDEDSFEACDAIAFERFPTGDGYTGAGIIGAKSGTRKTLKDWIADWNRSCNCRSGATHFGQIRVVMLHPTIAIKAAAPLFDDAIEILDGTFDPNILWSEHANLIPFKADFDHVAGDWKTVSAAKDDALITNYKRTITGETREYPFAPGITNSYHVALMELLVFRHPPRTVQFETGLTGLVTLDLGDYFKYRHFASITDTVGQVRLAQITRHQVQAGARRVLVEALDCEEIIGYDVPGSGTGGSAVLPDTCADAREFVYAEPPEGSSWWQRFTIDTTPHEEDASIAALVSPNSNKKPAWFKFTAPAAGNLSVITTTTAYDDYIYFLEGTCGEDDWSVLNSNDDNVGFTAGETVNLLAGQTVYILLVGKTDADFGFLLAQASFTPD